MKYTALLDVTLAVLSTVDTLGAGVAYRTPARCDEWKWISAAGRYGLRQTMRCVWIWVRAGAGGTRPQAERPIKDPREKNN